MTEPRNRLCRPLARTAAVAAFTALVAAGATAQEAELPLRDVADAVRGALPPPDTSPFLGVILAQGGRGTAIERVVAGSAAARAGLRGGDEILSFGGAAIRAGDEIERLLTQRAPGEAVGLRIRRGEKPRDVVVRLGSRRLPDACFRGGTFHLGVVPLAFGDDRTSPPDAGTLTALLFRRTGVTGAGASLSDYFRAQSHERLDVGGEVLAPLTLPGPRAKWADGPMGGPPGSLFDRAALLLAEREGESRLRDFDGLAFVHTGEAETRPGRALWPHRSAVQIGERKIPYYVHVAADPRSEAIGVHCHEFGHLLGLPDAYGAAHLTGSGDFCLMAIGHRGGGATGSRSPFSLCAWCRMRLGWIDPVTIDPRVGQRIRLRPVSAGPGEALLVPLTKRTNEYLLLEVRRREGFDRELPSAGLLVWHVGGGAKPGQGPYGSYIDLIEAHGVDSFEGSLIRTADIAFPTRRARDLTPDTQPAIRSSRAGAFRVHLSAIERLADGAVALTIGVPRRVQQPSPEPWSTDGPDRDGFVARRDPITGAVTRLRIVGEPDVLLPAGAEGGEERR